MRYNYRFQSYMNRQRVSSKRNFNVHYETQELIKFSTALTSRLLLYNIHPTRAAECNTVNILTEF